MSIIQRALEKELSSVRRRLLNVEQQLAANPSIRNLEIVREARSILQQDQKTQADFNKVLQLGAEQKRLPSLNARQRTTLLDKRTRLQKDEMQLANFLSIIYLRTELSLHSLR